MAEEDLQEVTFMSIFSLFSIPSIIEGIMGIIGKHVSDPGVMAEVKAQILALEVPEDIEQAKIEASNQSSPDKYIRYVRSTAEWVCVYGLFVGVVITPLLEMFGFPFPVMPMPLILNLLYALLGLGATRVAESVFAKGL